MNTMLDLLIIVVMALAAVSLAAMALMFLVRNEKVRRVCLYIVAALGIYLGYVGIRINYPGFYFQAVLAAVAALASVAAVVLSRGNGKRFLAARVLAAVALVIGMLNAFM